MGIDEHPDGGAAQRQSPSFGTPGWWIYRGTGRPLRDIRLTDVLPAPPPWRDFGGGPIAVRDVPPPDDGEARRRLGAESHLSERNVDPHEVDMVNAALYLRRPLLVTGRPGTGKSSLAYRIARELGLGRVLRWPITSRTTLNSGLYAYDAIGRAQAAATRQALARWGVDADTSSLSADRAMTLAEPPVGEFLRLGPLGTAFLPAELPRVLLIDELDKSEVDLPNDLLSIFEDGQFTISELERMRDRSPEVTVLADDPGTTATVVDGRVSCRAFPMVVITSNGEREFPEAFLRRCLRLTIKEPTIEQLAAMVAAHLADSDDEQRQRMIQEFLDRAADGGGLPADKLLDAVYLATSGAYHDDDSWSRLLDALWRQLTSVT
ncbi:MoxR family ATPase [Saccharopolyspora sp. K220]|uniref:AAA family ATPase n=1 Tax=Saccharopolyspora soli TaxID=2926618 RepID=UPI001F58F747|nr:MoxR family ATPase [Saccharopolyspora soli]MCI2415857.1 MoxR family ATPase [Saccharopolyspora soli]